MKILSFKTLSEHVKSLPVISDQTHYIGSKCTLVQDEDRSFLITYYQISSTIIYSISLGYFIKKKSLNQYRTYNNEFPEFVNFSEDSTFLLHNLDGPSYLTEDSILHVIHGKSFSENDFNLHPEVIEHKNKLSLKKKLKSL